jgi:hypothetical protein
MGHRRPRPLLLGAVVVAAVLATPLSASSQPARPSVVRADVLATGQPEAPARGWRVERATMGTYRIALPDDRVVLDVPAWEGVADVTVRPLGAGANEVRFTRDGAPVDTAFTFVAVVHR